jgi:hypothetical protein
LTPENFVNVFGEHHFQQIIVISRLRRKEGLASLTLVFELFLVPGSWFFVPECLIQRPKPKDPGPLLHLHNLRLAFLVFRIFEDDVGGLLADHVDGADDKEAGNAGKD